jgi:hypothetical protein
MQQTKCLNCGDALPEEKNFCASCGQKANTHRLTLNEILHDALHAITHADKGFFHLVKELAIRPGTVAREYIAGRRKKYFNPFSLLVIVTGILVLVSSNFRIFGDDSLARTETSGVDAPAKINTAKEGSKKRTIQFTDFINNHSNILPFISTPFLSFLFWIFYKRKKLFYAEHLTSMAFFNAFVMIVTALFFGPIIYLTRHLGTFRILLPLMLLFHVIYFSIAYKQLFNYAGLKGFFKAFGNSLLAIFCWMIFAVAMGTVYIFLGR